MKNYFLHLHKNDFYGTYHYDHFNRADGALGTTEDGYPWATLTEDNPEQFGVVNRKLVFEPNISTGSSAQFFLENLSCAGKNIFVSATISASFADADISWMYIRRTDTYVGADPVVAIMMGGGGSILCISRTGVDDVTFDTGITDVPEGSVIAIHSIDAVAKFYLNGDLICEMPDYAYYIDSENWAGFYVESSAGSGEVWLDNFDLQIDDKNKSWLSPVIDLYDNESAESQLATPSYTNYSVTKSPGYGTNLLHDNTWTGLDYEIASPATPTETGFVKAGRYVDESGRIDILDHFIELGEYEGSADIVPIVTVYTTDDPYESEWTEGWAVKENIAENRPIVLFGAKRYARFKIDFTTDIPDISDLDLDLYVRVKINAPIQVPFYENTRGLLNKFPQWMDMREYSSTPTPLVYESGDGVVSNLVSITATPFSVGGQVLNAVAGEWLNEIEQDLSYTALQQFIGTADLDQTAWVYYASETPEYVYRVEGDYVELAHTVDLREFYEQSETDDAFWWDSDKDLVYLKRDYTLLTINGTEYTTSPQHVWNWFDEFGLTVDLPRHLLEDNETYRHRILDVYKNKPGVGIEAFKLALRRELNLWDAEGATPYSEYQGATPEVLEIEDLEHHTDFFDYDGLPTDKMVKLVEDLAEQYPTTWGFFKWNKAFWDIGGIAERSDDYGQGYDVLPYRYDASPNLPDINTQSGVGDGNDLYIHRPDEITGPREFNATMKLRGRYKSFREEWPKVTVEGYVYGRADRTIYSNPTITPWFTFRVETDDGDIYYHEHQASVTSDVDVNRALPSEGSYYSIQIFQEGRTLPGLVWFDVSGNQYTTDGATPFSIATDSIRWLEVHLGRYETTGGIPYWHSSPTDDLDIWPAAEPNNSMNTVDGATPTALTVVNPSIADTFIVRSNETSSAVGYWYSEKQPFVVELNGEPPSNGYKDYVMPVPTIVWDNYLEVTPNKKYIVELTSQNSDGSFGAWTEDSNGDSLFLDDVYIIVNGASAWNATTGIQIFNQGSTTEFTWYTGESATPNYPISAPYWDLFEARADTAIYGVVDENGPWRNGIPSPPGNSNFNFSIVNVSRADFGIPDGVTYVPTWMGVEVDSDKVIAWLDSNVINPANDDDSVTTTYPAGAIEEIFHGDTSAFYFDPFILRARLRPGISPEWYPSMNSGYFYDRQQEYYHYAHPGVETATANNFVLQDVARQGAPIIAYTVQESPATPYEYRQVSFYDSTPFSDGATVDTLSLVNTQTVWGTGTNKLYLAYEDVYDVSVVRLDTNESFSSDTFTSTNELTTSEDTDWDTQYDVTYTVRYSYYADNEYVHDDETQRTRLTFASPGIPSDATPVEISYETSRFDPATPIEVPLHTFYTTIDEGYIFLSYNEYTLTKVEVRLSPSKIIADGQDYLMITLRSLDEHNNPLPDQGFDLETTFGTFDLEQASPDGGTISVITDGDGFAVAVLNSWPTTSSLSGTVTITGGVAATVDFKIDVIEQDGVYRLTALPTSDAVVADGQSKVAVYGRIEDSEYNPVPNATIYYRKGRSMHEVFTTAYDTTYVGHDNATPRWPDTGRTYADSDGRFILGPFTAATPGSPGYWFLAAESWEDATPSATPGYDPVGDVVFWYEYPDIAYGVNDSNNLPIQPVQYETPWFDVPQQATVNSFPVYYDDATPEAASTPGTALWDPPMWYAIQRYKQYQRGNLGTTRGEVDYSSLGNIHPSHRDH